MPSATALTPVLDQTRLGLMKLVNIQAAKTHLSRLVEEAARGEEIVLAKAGRPYVKLVPCTASVTPRKLGGWENAVRIAPDFDDVDVDILRLFEGEPKPTKARRRAPSNP